MIFKKLLGNRKGTAEVIGTIMFVMIILFLFTNVYLYHDNATKEMNDLSARKMQAGMTLAYDIDGHSVITATGSEVVLSRLWITASSGHTYSPLNDIRMAAGQKITIQFDGQHSGDADDSVSSYYEDSSNTLFVHYSSGDITALSLVNTMGIVLGPFTASPT
jgi:hypothetical protein